MAALDFIIKPLADAISKRIEESKETVTRSVSYRRGKQKRQLKKTMTGVDDNLVVNFSDLVCQRSISMVLGDGVVFDLPVDDEAEEQIFINDLMKANKQEILLARALNFAADGGTGYFKILPGGAFGIGGQEYNRIVALNPGHVTMQTSPHDIEVVIRYIIEYWQKDGDGKAKGYREVHEWAAIDGESTEEVQDGQWDIVRYETDTNGKWFEVNREVWPYDFPAIIHWQNLPNPYDPEGLPDLSDSVIELQDRYNFIMSNLSKIVRYSAHPMRYGVNLGSAENMAWGVDEMPVFSGSGMDKPEIVQLEQLGDLASSNQLARDVRQAIFDITRTVDIDSMQDKLGSLTNFGLRVLYTDAINKTQAKRLLFGEALLELVRRLLVINEFSATDPGLIVWPDTMPQNEKEEIEYLERDIANELVSRETASTKRGYRYADEKDKITVEAQERRLAQSNVGAALLEQFIAGGQ